MLPIDERTPVVSFAAIEARARSRAATFDLRVRAKRGVQAELARRKADLAAEGFVLPLSEWIGHNNGPDWQDSALFIEYCWRRACRKAWTPPIPEIALRRARRAAMLGVSYRRYVLEILERGRYLDEESSRQIHEREGVPKC